jgi:hypothetical protein
LCRSLDTCTPPSIVVTQTSVNTVIDRREENEPQYLASDSFQNLLLKLPLDFMALVVCRGFSMQIQQSAEVKLRRLEKLDFANVDLSRV